MVMTMFSNSLAGGSGTLTVTCKYFDDSSVEQPLSVAYVYLRELAGQIYSATHIFFENGLYGGW